MIYLFPKMGLNSDRVFIALGVTSFRPAEINCPTPDARLASHVSAVLAEPPRVRLAIWISLAPSEVLRVRLAQQTNAVLAGAPRVRLVTRVNRATPEPLRVKLAQQATALFANLRASGVRSGSVQHHRSPCV